MWQSRYQVTKSNGVGGDPIPHDEPVLVIRAQDILALRMMNEYIHAYEAMTKHNPEVLERLNNHRIALREWQERNKDKMKLAD